MNLVGIIGTRTCGSKVKNSLYLVLLKNNFEKLTKNWNIYGTLFCNLVFIKIKNI